MVDTVAIGANAVVVGDVPSELVAVGVPAVVKPRLPVFKARRAQCGADADAEDETEGAQAARGQVHHFPGRMRN